MKAGGLIVEHHVVGAGDTHKVIAACGGQQQEQIIGRVLVGGGMVGVADVDAHGQSQQLTHKVIFEAGADDLALVVEILRADKANHAVDEKGFEDASHTVSAGFQGELVDSVMSLGGEGAALASFEVHDIGNRVTRDRVIG